MTFTLGFILVGFLLVGMALAGSLLRRLPISAAMIYVVVGLLLGPIGIGLIDLDPLEDSELIERVTEVAVIISLFTAGLKLRVSIFDPMWRVSLRLALVAMLVTIGLIALVAHVALDMRVGLAILLGAALAPTDPVLASDVQVRTPDDRDQLRFSLTSEAGLNDGTAFPFVLLGLGLLHLHELGDSGWRWLSIDVIWAVTVGLGIGTLLGTLVGQIVIYLRRSHSEAIGLDDFLALGLIALSYGTALLVNAYGFLAVFAAGLAVRRIEARSSSSEDIEDIQLPTSIEDEVPSEASEPATAPAYMTAAVLHFNEQVERIGTTVVVVLVGAMLSMTYLHAEAIWFIPLLLIVIRPVSVLLALLGSGVPPPERRMMGWFGMRGVGSIFYLAFAIEHGLSGSDAEQLASMTLSVVAVSIVVHGISMTPLMRRHERRQRRLVE
jgi:NhaP-type Na+/H+ or K+/H+ antiporter